MAIHRNYGEIEFHCDTPGCHEFYETQTKQFDSAIRILAAAPWCKRNGVITCPDCLQTEKPSCDRD